MFPRAVLWPLLLMTGQWLRTGCVTVQQNQVTGIENRSVLLPVCYGARYQHYLKISWSFQAFRTPFLIWSSLNASSNSSRHIFTWESYRHRTSLFPENASLLLQDLRLNDTGTYRVKVRGDSGSGMGQINLTVLPGAATKDQAAGVWESSSRAGTANSTRIMNFMRIALASVLVYLCFVVAFVDTFLK